MATREVPRHRIRAVFFLFCSLTAVLTREALAQASLPAGSGPSGGNVYAVAADPSHPGTLYAGTQRGVFRTADGGLSWAFTGSGIPPTRVQAIAVDPANTDVLYAGTRTPDGVPSVGIFRSVDGGATWSTANIGLFDPFTAIGPLDVESIAIDPADPNVLLAGTDLSEIFRSADGGANWQAVTFGGNSAGLETTEIVFDPQAPANVYAASTLGLLKSVDGGLTWSPFGNAGVPFYALAVDPTAPQTLYAGDATGSGIWKSTDGGSHWATANVSLPGAAGSRPLILALAVDPAHASTVYAATYGDGVWMSTDAGATWSTSSGGMRDTRVSSLVLSPSQPAMIYAGSYGGGVYASRDGAQSWATADSGLNASIVSAVLVDPAAVGLVYAATSDGVSVSEDAGVGWSVSGSGLPPVSVSALAFAPGTGVSGVSFSLLAGTLGSGLYRSADRGSTWTSTGSGLNDSYVSALAADPSSPATLYAGTAHPYTGSNSERVFKSTDGGATWTQTSLDANQFPVDFIGVDPALPGRVFAGSFGATGLFRSLDGGTTWSTIATGVCGGVSGLAFDAASSTVFLAGTAGVCRSSDGGGTWTLASVGGLLVSSVAVDPETPTTVYAGTSPDLVPGAAGGVFVSADGGQTFRAMDTGVLPAAVETIAVDPRTSVVYAGTAGAGVAALFPAQERAPVLLPPPGARRPPRAIDPR